MLDLNQLLINKAQYNITKIKNGSKIYKYLIINFDDNTELSIKKSQLIINSGDSVKICNINSKILLDDSYKESKYQDDGIKNLLDINNLFIKKCTNIIEKAIVEFSNEFPVDYIILSDISSTPIEIYSGYFGLMFLELCEKYSLEDIENNFSNKQTFTKYGSGINYFLLECDSLDLIDSTKLKSCCILLDHNSIINNNSKYPINEYMLMLTTYNYSIFLLDYSLKDKFDLKHILEQSELIITEIDEFDIFKEDINFKNSTIILNNNSRDEALFNNIKEKVLFITTNEDMLIIKEFSQWIL